MFRVRGIRTGQGNISVRRESLQPVRSHLAAFPGSMDWSQTQSRWQLAYSILFEYFGYMQNTDAECHDLAGKFYEAFATEVIQKIAPSNLSSDWILNQKDVASWFVAKVLVL